MTAPAMDLRWQRLGVCVDDPERWSTPGTAALAVHMCLWHCPVLEQCRQWATGREWDSVVVAGRWWIGPRDGHPPRPAVDQPEEPCDACRGCGGCTECGKPIIGRPPSARTCSPRCSVARRRRRARGNEARARANGLRRERRYCAVCRAGLPAGWPSRRPICVKDSCAEVWRARQSRASTTRFRRKSGEMELAA